MTPRNRFPLGLIALFAVCGCGAEQADPGKTAASQQLLRTGDDAFQAKKYADAIKAYDETIKTGVLQPDVLADTYVKRAACRIELGDLDGAADDLAQAERGGAVGEDYQKAQKILSEKRSGS